MIRFFDKQQNESTEEVLLRLNASSHYGETPKDEEVMNFQKLMKLADRHGLPLQLYPVELTFSEDGENSQLEFYVVNEPADEATFKEVTSTIESGNFADMVELNFEPRDEDAEQEEATDKKPRRAPAKKAASKKKTTAKKAESGETEEPDNGGEEAETPDETVADDGASKPVRGRRTRSTRKAAAEEGGAEDDGLVTGDDMDGLLAGVDAL